MHELMFQAGVKGMSERSELIPCMNTIIRYVHLRYDTNSYTLETQQQWVESEALGTKQGREQCGETTDNIPRETRENLLK